MWPPSHLASGVELARRETHGWPCRQVFTPVNAIDLLGFEPDERRAAFASAVAAQTFGVEYVRHYLRHPEAGAARAPPPPCPPATARQESRPRSAERSEGSLDARPSGGHLVLVARQGVL